VFSPWYFRLHTFEHTTCIRGLGKNKRYARVHHRRTLALVLVWVIHWIFIKLDLFLLLLLVQNISLASSHFDKSIVP
jgi:hypothetical protein